MGCVCVGNAGPGMDLDVGGEQGVGRARAAVRVLLASRGWHEDRVEVVCLVLSELVANALIHGGGLSLVTVEADDVLARVVVGDRSTAAPVVLPASPTRLRGRGLHLVEQLSVRWGVDLNGSAGKQVWAEVTDEPTDRPAG